jgi:ribosomal protein S2
MTDPVDVPLPDDDDSRRKSEHVQGIVQETIERQRKKGILNQKNQDKEEQKPAQQTKTYRQNRPWNLSTL